jgi:tRNA dimethylallyltransferase
MTPTDTTPNCLVVCGPTASGKTRLAVRLARAFAGEILSADSRQVYRGMDIGTGKDLSEYGSGSSGGKSPGGPVPYHLIDIAEPSQIYTLYDYQRDFYRAFEDVLERGKLPIIAGGSGLYIEAAIRGYAIPPVPENPSFRRETMKESREALIDLLRAESPDVLARTDTSTKKRLVRALEVARFGGKGGGRLLDGRELGAGANTNADINANVNPCPKITPLILYVVWERQELRARIEKRLRERLESGLVDEVDRLIKSGIGRDRFSLFGMEYKHAARYINGEVSREEMFSQLLQDICRLAKRQDTWFRGMERRGMTVHRIPCADFEAAAQVARFSTKSAPNSV